MKKITKILFLALFSILIISGLLSAQVPEAISYQAVVRDADGNVLINTDIGMRITIRSFPVHGRIHYRETQTAQTNSNGVVSVNIGEGTSIYDFSEIGWWHANLPVIEVEIDPTGGTDYTILSTSDLLSVPYALSAKIAIRANSIQNGDVSGFRANSLGANNTVSGHMATAIGNYNTTSGDYSIAMGRRSIASGDFSMAMGRRSIASGDFSTAMGDSATAEGVTSFAVGKQSHAQADHSTALGYETLASGILSTAMGVQTKATDWAATAMGNGTTASGGNSTAMGLNTQATGNNSTAMGSSTYAYGANSLASGNLSLAQGNNSTAMGHNSTADGDLSFAINLSTTAGPSVGASAFRISGASSIGGNLAWTNHSDRRLKKDISLIGEENNLGKILQLNSVRYKWADGTNDNLNLGFIAQDVENIVPESVRYDSANDIYSMEYSAIIPVLVEAVKELEAIVREQNKKISELESKISQ